MSATTHKDPSKGWLTLFFVCFILTVFAIGVAAGLGVFPSVDNGPPQAGGGAHGG